MRKCDERAIKTESASTGRGSDPALKGKASDVAASRPQSGWGKDFGGSDSYAFNRNLVNEALQSLWLAHSDKAAADLKYQAALATMMGIAPRDEIEGMLAAQMVATHNAAMECFRRAMLDNQTF